ncbi:MAG: N-acetylneuraminate synthase [Alphaproteobacteria bacterium]|nr:N-acetylneuraminate synthase [Alphaproteobacteria bacterium]
MSVFIIAEAGVNHGGELGQALALVDAAVQAGADAVKFQTFKTEALVAKDAPKATYQALNTGADDGQFAMLKRLELSPKDHIALMMHCQKKGIGFLSSPFDLDSLGFLVATLGLGIIKLGSGEITNAPLLLAAGQQARHFLLSTGMSTPEEIEDALGVLAFAMTTPENAAPSSLAFKTAFISKAGQQALQTRVTLLHCTTDYPANPSEANLKAIPALSDRFKLRIGFSDHTPGISVALGAVALGAAVIEKHLTLDRDLPGPDHKASLEPHEFKALVEGVRVVESALGDGVKRPMPSELPNRKVARKSLAALSPIAKDETFSALNLGALRPGDGVSPMAYWDWLGKTALRNLQPGERLP